MAIDGLKPVSALSIARPSGAGRVESGPVAATQGLPDKGVDLVISSAALGGPSASGPGQDQTDALIASWFKHLSPANSEADKRRTAEEDHKKRAAQAAGRIYSDPGRLPDPVKEPSRKTIETAVDIIATDEILDAMSSRSHHDDPADR